MSIDQLPYAPIRFVGWVLSLGVRVVLAVDDALDCWGDDA